jgi:FAD/FMN-containing dehydrogenase
VKYVLLSRRDRRIRQRHGGVGRLAIDVDDMRDVLDAGVTRAQIEDALAVGLAFGITARLANAFDFDMATPAATNAGAKHLLRRGYR